jgi:TRAP-type C4-dicarboxylate transport system permease small subunit
MSTFVDAIRIVFLAYCTYLTVALMQKIGSQRMAIVDWPIGILYGFVVLGFGLMTWRATGVAIDNWKRGYSVLERPELADEMK